jgi:carboxylate-amine ligase
MPGYTAPMVTLGVEEEYLLLDPASGLPVPMSRQVRVAAQLAPTTSTETEITPELLQAQVEVATPICADLDEVAEHLTRLRGVVSTAAGSTGCRAAACGAAVVRGTQPVPVTGKARYLVMSGDAAQLVDEQLINGMHVHVGIPDRDSAVGALNQIRPWLPVLVALGANSPLWDGRDTGFSSWRTVIFGRWPVSGCPPEFADAADYGRRTQALVDSEAIRDLGQLYWSARLSENFPTIEVRALDVQLRVEDAVTLAGIIRALVVRGLADHEHVRKNGIDHKRRSAEPELLASATWQAARHGLEGRLVDPTTGRAQSAEQVIASLLDHLTPALEESGDLERVTQGVQRLIRDGNGAHRQRSAFQSSGLTAALDLSEM